MNYRSSIRLLRKYLSGNASIDEVAKVEKWYSAAEEKEIHEDNVEASDVDYTREKIYNKILSALQKEHVIIPFYKKTSFRVCAAAAILFIIAGSVFFSVKNKTIQQQAAITPVMKHDVAPPVSNKAVLTLADGSKISIDSVDKGIVAVQGNVDVIKQSNGVLTYNGTAHQSNVYNTLSVPRGSKPVKLKLADGSLVWLNVASSITYPVSFADKERKVTITGEAYFEVVHNDAVPFIVQQGNSDMQVRVLGTHFNVNTYNDEASMNVTLLEGKVNVTANNNSAVLSPGQQARVSEKGVKTVDGVDLNEVMAWKNGTFYFDGADIKTIMRQVEKWYNVDVVYQDDIKYSFVAKISRDVNASELLKILELTDLVHFKIDGNKITVVK